MRKIYSLLLGLLCMSTASAQSWTEPTVPTEGSDPVSGHIYRVKNTEEGLYLAYGTVWFGWNTTAMMVDPEAQDPLSFTLTEEFDEENNSLGWTFKNYDGPWPNQYVFVSGNDIAGFAMHVDNPTDPHRYFELLKQENGNYHIRVAAQVDTYGQSALEDWADRCWGWGGYEDATGQNFAIYASVKPEDGFFCDWQLVDVSVFIARQKLFELAVTIEEEDLGVDYEAYTEVYNGEDLEALNAAVTELNQQIQTARAYAVLRYGEDGLNPPSNDNPADATSLIVNSDFSEGNINGWTCTFVSGKNASNVGYQGANYTNGDVQISQFIEAWTPNQMNPNCSWAAIGDGELSQTMYGLPAGKYTFTCDAIAVAQWGNPNPVSGVQLFAKGGDIDMFQTIATGDALPEHYEVTFVSSGGDVTLGLRTVNATANWIAADNFTLTYYGEVSDNPYQAVLKDRIAQLEQQYEYVEDVKANKDVKEAFESAMEAARTAADNNEGTDEYYQQATEALNAAAKALETSINDYIALKKTIDGLREKNEQLATAWPELVDGEDGLADMVDQLDNAYEEGTITSEAIAAVQEEISKKIADYISENCKAGDDLTILLNNPGFDTDQSGWEITNYEGTGNVSAGNHRWGGQNIILPAGFIKEDGEEVMEDETLMSGCNEIWKGAFKYQQTILNMPAGLYTLSCKGFQRNENNQNDTSVPANAAELFAITNGDKVQTQKFANIFGDCSETMLYNGPSVGEYGVAYGGGVGTETDLNSATPAEGLYYPNGMCGASAHFAAGYYKQEFNFVLTETSDVTIGARCQADYYWTLFDDFQLVYQGQDANAYAPVIENLIAQAEKEGQGEEDILTTEATDKIDQAIKQGQDAIDAANIDDCIAAIEALRDAIAFAESTLVETKKLAEEYQVMVDYRYGDIDLVSTEETFPTLIETIGTAIENKEIKDMAEIESFRQQMKAGFTAYVMYDIKDGATEEESADITAVIYNPDYQNYGISENSNVTGWDVEGTPGFNGTSAEFFNQNFSMTQTIYNLAKGYYVLTVPGYYRDGEFAGVETILNTEGGSETQRVFLSAGDAKTKMLPISYNMAEYSEMNPEGGSITVGEEQFYVPNDMAQGVIAFENELYVNKLQFEVAEDGTDVVIGLSKEETITNDWTMLGVWKLEYIGTATPTEDPTTQIAGVEAEAPVKAAIFNLAGQRVSKAVKGIYIVNGKKVVIK
ncbi:MAG: hypothetical protein IJ762_04000 [Bacteroidaceae bacterium]|nr:hypothetical protein [Bacteroidaceae bacterium]